jgi:hypothetical protein
MRWAGQVACTGAKRRVLVGTQVGKILPGRPGHRWEDDFKMDIREI